jgi:limonene-1,2-epoxide hydrolase
MRSAEEVVRAFCGLVGEKDLGAVEELLDEKVVYHNVGMEPSVGRDATLAAIRFQFETFDPIVFRIVNLASDGDTVLTERVDEVTANGITAPVPVMGTFVVAGGRIVTWRDYFDMGLTSRLMSGEDAAAVLPAL